MKGMIWVAWWVAVVAVGCADTSQGTYTQEEQDAEVGRAVADAIDRLFSLKLAAQTPGEIDVTVSCPAGGTAHVVGTIERDQSGYLSARQLQYDLSSCRIKAVTSVIFDLELAGALSETASYSRNGDIWTSHNSYASPQLNINGSGLGVPASGGAPASFAVDESCALALDQSLEGSQGSISGTLCDRSVNAQINDGSASDGGTGTIDAGSGNCPTTAAELGCCSTSSGIQVIGVTVPGDCQCPQGTCYTGYDTLYQVNQCGCADCWSCP